MFAFKYLQMTFAKYFQSVEDYFHNWLHMQNSPIYGSDFLPGQVVGKRSITKPQLL